MWAGVAALLAGGGWVAIMAALPALIAVAVLAIAWVLAHPEVTCALCGARRDMQIDEIVEAVDFPLSMAEVEEINALVEFAE